MGPTSYQNTYVILLRARLRLTGVKWSTYLAPYGAGRGMHFTNDFHDWLGGYPYESMRPQDLIRLVCNRGFGECETDTQSSHTPLGFFGSGCQEYVFVKES